MVFALRFVADAASFPASPDLIPRAIVEDRIVVTEDADDFRHLAAEADMNPGVIVLPSVTRDEMRRLMGTVVARPLARSDGRPEDAVVDAVPTIDGTGRVTVEPLP